jgi:PIN domain nuclease of toxin-antitoxin system
VIEVVFDASALLALMRGERGADVVAAHLGRAAMSSVNVAEVYGRLLREAFTPDEFRRYIEALDFEAYDFTVEQAFVAGRMEPSTRPLGLSLGDRACLALALHLGVPALSGDRRWEKLAVGVDVSLFR